jgi:Asp-tRNA(Asn)/Glu-tRNA(Gln) amidotransferase A subunit family amidase
MHEQLYYCDATDLANLVRSKQVSPIEIVRAHLVERIQWLNPRLNAVVTLNESAIPEFSFARESDNSVFGRTVNPWNTERTPGGSSGREAAAIAAGLSPLGLGSDVAISIRGPAHYCGVVGLKATHGRIPLTGHWPEALRRFWHVGPLARSIRDAALVLSVLAGPDGQDGYAVPPATPNGTFDRDPLAWIIHERTDGSAEAPPRHGQDGLGRRETESGRACRKVHG